MNIHLPTYKKSLSSYREPVMNPESWDEAERLFEEEKYIQSIAMVLESAHTGIMEGINVQQGFSLTRPHGSTLISIEVNNDFLQINVPFLKITDKTNKVALLRKIAENNFNALYLSQIILREDKLYYTLKMPLPLCLPDKVYFSLIKICINADYLDDVLINQFGAEFLQQPNRTPLTEEENNNISRYLELIFTEYKILTEMFRKERKEDFYWDVIVISLLKISNISYVQGQLRTDLYDIIATLTDTQTDFKQRVDKGKKFMDTLMSKEKNELMKDFYHAEFFMPLRQRSNPQIISERLIQYENTVNSYAKNKKYIDLAYMLQYIFIRLIYDYNLDLECRDKIEIALEKVSGMEVKKGGEILLKLYDEMSQPTDDKKEKTKSFFRKLFN